MKIREIFFTLAIFLLLLTYACNNKNRYVDRETVVLDSLIAILQDMRQTDPDKAINEIMEKRSSIMDSINYHRLNSFLSVTYFMNNQVDSAFILNEATLRFCNMQDESNLEAIRIKGEGYNNRGVMLQITGQEDSAIVCYKKATEQFIRLNEFDKILSIYINIADNSYQRGEYPAASELYRKTLLLADSLNVTHQLNPIYMGLSQVYISLKNLKLADFYLKKTEPVYDTLPTYDQYFFATTRGNYYYNTHDYEDALPWLHRANHVAKLLKHQSFLAITEFNLGEIHLLLNQLDSAQYYLNNVPDFVSSDFISPSMKFYWEELCASYFLAKDDLTQAEQYLLIPFDVNSIDPKYLYYREKRLEELYKKRGDYRKAYEFADKANRYDDSIRNVTIQNQIAEVDMRYRQDTTILKRDILLGEKEQKVQSLKKTNLLLGAVVVVFILAVSVFTLYRQKKRELQQTRQVAAITKLRLESVRNRISPHFMFNILNSVVPSLREYKDLARPMQLLIESIRGNLSLSEKLAITLEEEIAIVKNYLALLESIQSDLPQIIWDITPDVNMLSQVPSMILQIPVENAIKYAFEGEIKEKLLKINIYSQDHAIILNIKDNGVGFSAKRNNNKDKGTGTGLNILYKTIEMLNVQNKHKMEFEIKNEVNISVDKHGTDVFIKIPTDYKYEI